MKKILAVVMSLSMILSFGVISASAENTSHNIVLSSTKNSDGSYTNSATVDGETVIEYDYTWSVDPSQNYGEVKNSPAEHYTGTEPGDESVYIAHDITYYPTLDTSKYKKVQYDDETEWAYYYTAEGFTDFIFATLPVTGNTVPTSMMHTAEEAYNNPVLHITEAGTYTISGTWHGQIKIDLGDDAFDDENCKVKLILNGVDVTCTVAPAINFYSVYECDNTWEDRETYTQEADLTNAGAIVYLAANKTNNISGTNVFRMLKTKYKDEESSNANSVALQKKMIKTDAAFYSYESMVIDGDDTGVLNITSGYEGLDTELHLAINGGNINIYSQDDGINTNEDKVSVTQFNGGCTHIFAGLGSEGDGIDSNGYLVINGGTLVSMAKPQSDSGLDSDCGSYIYGGTVVALGSTMDGVSADNSGKGQVSANLKFSSMQNADEAIILTDTNGNVVFAYDPNQDEIAKNNTRTYQGAIISSPAIKQGTTYNVYIGGDVNGTTSNGFFTSDTATDFTDDAKLQGYSGTGSNMGPGGNPNDINNNNNNTPPEKPDGESQSNGNVQPPEIPTDNTQNEGGTQPTDNNTTPPEKPDGDDNFIPDNNGGTQTGNLSTEFTMTNIVNNFAGVTDTNSDNSSDNDDENQNFFQRIFSRFISFFKGLFQYIKDFFAN